MKAWTKSGGWAAVALLVLLTGCLSDRANVWVEQTDELAIAAGELDRLSLRTHDGSVSVIGRPDRNDILVTVHRRVGGKDLASAQACRDAIELQSVADGEGGHKIGWSFNTLKHRDWGAKVSYRVELPPRLAVRVVTHNGPITIRDIEGACETTSHNGEITARDIDGTCKITTHNGAVQVIAGAAPLTVRTENGRITAASTATRVDLESHNGPIVFDAEQCGRIGGRIMTHNGPVRVIVGPRASAEITCKSYNGRISCDAPWQQVEKSKRLAKGTLGSGGPPLAIETYNGPIKIVQAGL